MKKKIMIVVIILVVLLILLFPTKEYLKDGGTIVYKSLVYKISKVNRLITEEEMEAEGKIKDYDKGIIIEIFGIEVYNDVK